MNVIFMGTPDFAVPSLEMLIQSENRVVAVVTQPDRPKGRGNKLTPSPVKEVALKNDIPIYQPEKVRKNEEFINKLKDINPDLIVVVAYGQILPKTVLDIPKYGCINVHGSLLPKYRGAAPIQYAVINGEEKTGVTTQFMDVGVDTGDIILKKEIDIDGKDTAGTMHDKLSVLGAEVLKESVNMCESDQIIRHKQDDSQATYASVLKKKDGIIDWNKSSLKICNLIRGLNPWPSAYTYLDGKILKIWGADEYVPDADYQGKIGEIVDIIDGNLIIKTGEGYLLVDKIQLQGRKRMATKEFLKGYNIEQNTILGVNV